MDGIYRTEARGLNLARSKQPQQRWLDLCHMLGEEYWTVPSEECVSLEQGAVGPARLPENSMAGVEMVAVGRSEQGGEPASLSRRLQRVLAERNQALVAHRHLFERLVERDRQIGELELKLAEALQALEEAEQQATKLRSDLRAMQDERDQALSAERLLWERLAENQEETVRAREECRRLRQSWQRLDGELAQFRQQAVQRQQQVDAEREAWFQQQREWAARAAELRSTCESYARSLEMAQLRQQQQAAELARLVALTAEQATRLFEQQQHLVQLESLLAERDEKLLQQAADLRAAVEERAGLAARLEQVEQDLLSLRAACDAAVAAQAEARAALAQERAKGRAARRQLRRVLRRAAAQRQRNVRQARRRRALRQACALLQLRGEQARQRLRGTQKRLDSQSRTLEHLLQEQQRIEGERAEQARLLAQEREARAAAEAAAERLRHEVQCLSERVDGLQRERDSLEKAETRSHAQATVATATLQELKLQLADRETRLAELTQVLQQLQDQAAAAQQQLQQRDVTLAEHRQALQASEERAAAAERTAQEALARLAQLEAAHAEALRHAEGLAEELAAALAADEERLAWADHYRELEAKLAAQGQLLRATEAELSHVLAEWAQLAQAWKARDREDAQRYQALLHKLDALDQRLVNASTASSVPPEPPLGYVPDPAVILDLRRDASCEPSTQRNPALPDRTAPADCGPELALMPFVPSSPVVPAELRNWLVDRCRDLPRLAARLERLLDEFDEPTRSGNSAPHRVSLSKPPQEASENGFASLPAPRVEPSGHDAATAVPPPAAIADGRPVLRGLARLFSFFYARPR